MSKKKLTEEQIREEMETFNSSDEGSISWDGENSESEDHISQNEFDFSDTTDSDITLEDNTSFLSKDTSIQYSPSPLVSNECGRISSKNILNLTPGITSYACSRVSDEISAFELFFPPSIMHIILENTNAEGLRIYGSAWKPLSDKDMFCYFGVLILCGVYKSKNEATESLWNSETGRPIFPAAMPLKLFKIISRVIRFDSRATRNERRKSDKFAPIKELWDSWTEILPKLYNPSEFVTIDEQLIAFRGKCPFRQYMPKKPAKYGIKFWVLCDVKNSYAWNIKPYLGKQPGEVRQKNQGLRVVMDLSYGLKGHNITVDNYFTSYQLGQMLLRRNITMIGTIRKNKTTLPSKVLEVKGREVGSSIFAFTKDTTLVSYVPKKNKCVILQSTFHHDKQISNTDHKKPKIILDYNATKGAVDTLDKLLVSYSVKRKTNRWPQVVFYNILDISLYNAYVLFCEIQNSEAKKHFRKRRTFLEKLGHNLIKPFIMDRNTLPRGTFSKALIEQMKNVEESSETEKNEKHNKKRGRCNLCKNSDNKTSLKCGKCDSWVCKNHCNTIITCKKCKQ